MDKKVEGLTFNYYYFIKLKLMMETSTDIHIESARIQKEIKTHLGLNSSELVFEFGVKDGKSKLDLITINPRHNQSFLLHSELGFDKVDVLKKMLEYVKSFREKESSYTIQWMTKDERVLHTSYFRASNILDSLDKLYYGRDRNTITVFSVVLNPVS